jgi:putative N6-adenine-specific DNA methylase
MLLYQKTKRFFGQLADGLEDIGRQELASLGATDIAPGYRGIFFTADPQALYTIVYCTRLFTRILAPLIQFDCHSSKYLYRTAGNIEWTKFFSIADTFAVNATVSNSSIKHSQYAALCLKDAIVDQFRKASGKRPSVNTKDPDIRLNLHIENNKAIIALDLSGSSLHRRGYRQETVEAPMQETVAAAIVKMIEWDEERPLIDFMCGSGTIIAEALMHYCRIPAAYLRSGFGFSFLPDFDDLLWKKTRSGIDEQIRPLPADLIRGSDGEKKSIAASRTNLACLPYGDAVRLQVQKFQDIGRIEHAVIVSNPPYGLRMKGAVDISLFAQGLGDFLKQRCAGSIAYLYFGDREIIKSVGLRPAWKKPLKSGGLDGRLAKYELY